MLEIIIAMLEKMSEDVGYDVHKIEGEKSELIITIYDFEGFDEDWSEVMREYDVNAVHELIDYLEKHCISKNNNLYSYYYFEDFDVELGYLSYDI